MGLGGYLRLPIQRACLGRTDTRRLRRRLPDRQEEDMSERTIIRGNAFMQNLYGIGSSARSGESPAGWPYGDLGFRIARSLKVNRTLRGGSWVSIVLVDPQHITRYRAVPRLKNAAIGFRIAKRKI